MPRSLVFRQQREIAEWAIGLLQIGFGWRFMTSPVLESAQAYAKANFMSEHYWGALFLIVGITQLFITWSEKLKFRKRALFVSALLWTFWGFLILRANAPGQGVVIYLWMAWLSFAIWFRVKGQPQ